MTLDKWFNEQSLLLKVLLLVIPPVGWIVEILIRLSAFMRKNSNNNLLMLIIAIFGNVLWSIIDAVILIVTGKLFLFE